MIGNRASRHYWSLILYLPSSIEPEVKKVPAIAAVMRVASVAAMSALNPTSEMSFVLFGTRAAVPPTKMKKANTN